MKPLNIIIILLLTWILVFLFVLGIESDIKRNQEEQSHHHFYAHLKSGMIIEVHNKCFIYQTDYDGINGESIPLTSVDYVNEVTK